MFFKRRKKKRKVEMIISHDGKNWLIYNEQTRVSAKSLEELDKKLESALEGELENGPLEVLMSSDNEMIPNWMRPFMNHYFNRVLELPLRY